jgi:hypothetical protein
MGNLSTLTSAQLRRAADLKDKISRLERELFYILNIPSKSISSPKKSGMSASARAKIAAAQKARWAKVKGSRDLKKASQDNKKKRLTKVKHKMSAAAKAKISAAAKARWAKVKAAGKKSL